MYCKEGEKMDTKRAKVDYVDLSKYQRTIVISDIHGDDGGLLAC